MPELDIASTISEYITANFSPDGKEIGLDDSLREGGIIDSVGLLEVLLFIEESFGLSLDDDEVASPAFETIRGIIGHVDGKLARNR